MVSSKSHGSKLPHRSTLHSLGKDRPALLGRNPQQCIILQVQVGDGEAIHQCHAFILFIGADPHADLVPTPRFHFLGPTSIY